MPAVPTDHDAGWLRLIVTSAVLLGLTIHLLDLRHIKFVVPHDIGAELQASAVRDGGSRSYLSQAGDASLHQGRVGMIFAFGLYVPPYVIQPPLRAVVTTVVHFLAFLALAAFVGMLVEPMLGELTLVCLLFSIPHAGGFFPITAYPIEFERAESTPLFVLTDVSEVNGSLVSYSVAALSVDPMQRSALSILTADGVRGFQFAPADALDLLPMPAWQYSHGLYISELRLLQSIVTGTALVQSSRALNPSRRLTFWELPERFEGTEVPGVALAFGKGFSGQESTETRRWHWTDSPSGIGTIELRNRTGAPIQVTFSACIITGHAETSRLQLQFHDKTIELTATNVCWNVRQVLTLDPFTAGALV